jgi:hypothetical protein
VLAVQDTVPNARARQAEADDQQLYALALNRDTPPEVLAGIAARTSTYDRYLIYGQLPDSTRELVLGRLSTSPDADRRGQVARLTWIPQTLLEQLSTDSAWYVREQVAMNPTTPTELLRRQAQDSWFLVRIAVARNPHAPDDVVAALKDDPDVRVRKEAEKRAKVRQ